MNILQRQIPESRVIDLFAGSGALGLEALSRGALSADFVEKDGRTFRALQKNVEILGAGQAATLHRTDALAFAGGLASRAYDIAFADPPYAGAAAALLASRWLLAPFASILTIEHSPATEMPGNPDTRRYGSTAITIYRCED